MNWGPPGPKGGGPPIGGPDIGLQLEGGGRKEEEGGPQFTGGPPECDVGGLEPRPPQGPGVEQPDRPDGLPTKPCGPLKYQIYY